MIFTSYWSLVKRVPNPISISLTSPGWWRGIEIDELKPTWELLNAYKANKLDNSHYVKEYVRLLRERRVNARSIVRMLPKECTLMCWEKSGRFCHRRVFAS
jgi:Domain of unknown function DUF488